MGTFNSHIKFNKKRSKFSVISSKDAGTFPLVIAQVMLSYLCLSPLQTGLKWQILSFILFLNVLCMLLGHMYYMFENISDFAIMGSTCTTVSASIQTTTKIFLLNYHKHNLANIWNVMSSEFWPADLVNKDIESTIRKKSKMITLMVLTYLSSAFLSAWDYMAIHLVFGRRILPLESTFPFDWRITPTFELVTIWQFILHMYTIIHTIATHDFFFNSLVSSCNAQFQLLQGVLSTIGTETGQSVKINRRLRLLFPKKQFMKYRNKDDLEFDLILRCVEHHNKVINICGKLQQIYGGIILMQFFLSALALCVSTFVLTQFNNYLTKMLSFAVAHLIQFFFLCAIANDLIYQSLGVADAAYASQWYNRTSNKVRHALMLIIQRAHREQKISALGFANLDYPNFVNVLRFSFSFYTLLSSLKEK